jgi:rhodanese-related sulfurtransferase
VALIGHEVDYVIDFAGGRAGLLVVRKRLDGRPAGEALGETLGMALEAIEAIEQDGGGGFRFATDGFEVQVFDRARAANDDDSFAALRAELEPVAAALFGAEGLTLARADADDARKALALHVGTPRSEPAATLAARLGSAAPAPAPQAPAMVPQSEWDISVEELKKLKDERATFQLVDVREQVEYETCHIDGVLVPLGTLAGRMDEFERSAHIVVHCRSGVRSAKAVVAMRRAGFENVWNVNGGILAWIERIDPSLTRY